MYSQEEAAESGRGEFGVEEVKEKRSLVQGRGRREDTLFFLKDRLICIESVSYFSK